MKYRIAFVVFGLVAAAFAANIEPQILKNLEEAETTNILVTFKKANSNAARARFESLRLTGREARLNTQYAILKDHADEVQADVMSLLKKTETVKKHLIAQLWVSADIIVRNVDKETVELLRNHPDVESLQAEFFLPLSNVMDETEEESYILNEYEDLPNDTISIQWGVANIRSGTAHSAGWTGQGIVAGVIDTGARHTHVALFSNYRGTIQGSHNYNWFVPSGGSAADPSDANGHGTHVIGSITGTANNIGVAPGGQWITCRGCNGASCSNFDLLQCGQWMACPTNTAGNAPQCNQAPRVVNNSWGGGRGSTFYDAVIATWRNNNITPLFSAGNSGPGCNTVISPSDRPGAISIGSTTSGNAISSFSSRGLTSDGRRKPDVSAPGTSIISAGHQADTQYRTLSGTSMASPHAAGLVVLLLSRTPNMSVAEVERRFNAGAVAIATSGQTCGGTPDSGRPNNTVGQGRIDVVNSFNAN